MASEVSSPTKKEDSNSAGFFERAVSEEPHETTRVQAEVKYSRRNGGVKIQEATKEQSQNAAKRTSAMYQKKIQTVFDFFFIFVVYGLFLGAYFMVKDF